MRQLGTIIASFLLATLSSCEWLASLPDSPTRHKPGSNPLSWDDGQISSLEFDEFFLLQESGAALVIDARPQYFYNLGHIPGAIHLPAGDRCAVWIDRELPRIEQAIEAGKTIVVYCNGYGCRDARTVSRHLSRRQIPVAVFSSGWKGWKKAGLPTESASHPPR